MTKAHLMPPATPQALALIVFLFVVTSNAGVGQEGLFAQQSTAAEGQSQSTDKAQSKSKSERPATTDKQASTFYEPVVRQVEGWTIKVDPELLADANKVIGDKALKALANHLQRITYIVREERLQQLQKLPIWVELENPGLSNMQYHPSRGWLSKNGHDPMLEKHVHIPRAKDLYARHMWAKHPYVVLHELAHSYHDSVLGFENRKIRNVYEQAKAEGIYDKVLSHTGRNVKHYGLNNAKEYFAESTEAYFGVNDFYPFVRAELRAHDPRMYALLREIWGEVK